MAGDDRSLVARIAQLVQEHVAIVDYDPQWPVMFEREKNHLVDCLPNALIRRIEHFGSTAVPGLPAKPIIDMLVEVTSLYDTKEQIVPILEGQGYDYFWRPTIGNEPPFYAWFIKRNEACVRTHHIHMVEGDFEHWERLYFRDYLREHAEIAADYGALKRRLSEEFPRDRVAYTKGKTEFIVRVTREAKRYYGVD